MSQKSTLLTFCIPAITIFTRPSLMLRKWMPFRGFDKRSIRSAQSESWNEDEDSDWSVSQERQYKRALISNKNNILQEKYPQWWLNTSPLRWLTYKYISLLTLEYSAWVTNTVSSTGSISITSGAELVAIQQTKFKRTKITVLWLHTTMTTNCHPTIILQRWRR